MSQNKKDETYVRLPYFGIPRLAPYLKPYGGILVSMVLLGSVGSIVDTIIPLFHSYALDNFVAEGHLNGLKTFVALYLLVLAVQVAANAISTYQACQIEMYVGRDMKQRSFDHLQTLSFS